MNSCVTLSAPFVLIRHTNLQTIRAVHSFVLDMRYIQQNGFEQFYRKDGTKLKLRHGKKTTYISNWEHDFRVSPLQARDWMATQYKHVPKPTKTVLQPWQLIRSPFKPSRLEGIFCEKQGRVPVTALSTPNVTCHDQMRLKLHNVARRLCYNVQLAQ